MQQQATELLHRRHRAMGGLATKHGCCPQQRRRLRQHAAVPSAGVVCHAAAAAAGATLCSSRPQPWSCTRRRCSSRPSSGGYDAAPHSLLGGRGPVQPSIHSSSSSVAPSNTSSSSSRPAVRLPPAGASLALVEPSVATSSAAGVTSLASQAGGALTGLSFSKVAAVVLGYCVMAGSLVRSVPQIIKVLKHNSTEGLSLTSYLVELACYSVAIAYNLCQGYQFNTFGEVVACWVQDVILITLVFKDRATPMWAIVATAAVFAGGCCFLLSPQCPPSMLASLQASNIAIMALGSRLPQILLNMRRGNAGMLSVLTCVLNVAGNAARIFTTLVLTGDLLMLGGFCSQGCLNAILLWQSVSTARARSRAAVAATAADADDSSRSSGLKQQQPQQRQRPEPDAPSGGSLPALQPAT